VPTDEENVSPAVWSTAVVACVLPGLLRVLYDAVTVTDHHRARAWLRVFVADPAQEAYAAIAGLIALRGGLTPGLEGLAPWHPTAPWHARRVRLAAHLAIAKQATSALAGCGLDRPRRSSVRRCTRSWGRLSPPRVRPLHPPTEPTPGGPPPLASGRRLR
jgi:hypothetical protein